jgi:hypothetical protein
MRHIFDTVSILLLFKTYYLLFLLILILIKKIRQPTSIKKIMKLIFYSISLFNLNDLLFI